jgi:hypothetical protein
MAVEADYTKKQKREEALMDRGYFPEGALPPEGQQDVPQGTQPQQMAQGITQQFGLDGGRQKFNTGGVTYEKDPRMTQKEYKTNLETKKLEMDLYGKTPEGKQAEAEKEILETEVKKSAESMPKLQNAFDAVNQLKSQFNSSASPSSVKKGDIGAGIASRFMGMKKGASAAIGADPELKTYLNNRKSFASLISKGGFLESGVLTDQDIKRVLDSIPDEYSTKEEADAGWREIDGILSGGLKRYDQKKQQLFNSINPKSQNNSNSSSQGNQVGRFVIEEE